jgi:hypothetical protein
VTMYYCDYCILSEETVREKKRKLQWVCCRLYPFIYWIIIKEAPSNFSSGRSPHWVNHVYLCLYCIMYLICFISTFVLFYCSTILFSNRVLILFLVRDTYDVTNVEHVFISEVIFLHEIPKKITSDRDSQFTSRFWKSLQLALVTQLNLSTTYHPKTDGKTERVNQIMEDMLRMHVMDNQTHWEKYLPLVYFTYNNIFDSSIGMPMYGRPCRTPLSLERLEYQVTIWT